MEIQKHAVKLSQCVAVSTSVLFSIYYDFHCSYFPFYYVSDAEDAVHGRDGYDLDGYRIRVEFPRRFFFHINFRYGSDVSSNLPFSMIQAHSGMAGIVGDVLTGAVVDTDGMAVAAASVVTAVAVAVAAVEICVAPSIVSSFQVQSLSAFIFFLRDRN